MDNFVFLLNYIEMKDEKIHSLASEFVKNELEIN